MAWSNAYLNKMRKYWCRNIVKAQYYASNTNRWYDAHITQKDVETTDVVIKFETTDSENLTITSIRLIDSGGEVAFLEGRNIVKKSTQGVLMQITAPIKEGGL